jgi:hypothetical protein
LGLAIPKIIEKSPAAYLYSFYAEEFQSTNCQASTCRKPTNLPKGAKLGLGELPGQIGQFVTERPELLGDSLRMQS